MPRRRCAVEIRNNTNYYTLSNPSKAIRWSNVATEMPGAGVCNPRPEGPGIFNFQIGFCFNTPESKSEVISRTLKNLQRRVHTESGFCQVPLPSMVDPCSAVKAHFNKTTGLASGAVGVFTYDLFDGELNDYNHIMAVMFSVPYDRVIYSNWFAVGIFNKDRKCDRSLFVKMYNAGESNFVRGKADEPALFYEGDYVILSASMTDSSEALLTVEINDTGLY